MTRLSSQLAELFNIASIPKKRYVPYAVISTILALGYTALGGWYEFTNADNKGIIRSILNTVEHLANAIPATVFLIAIVDIIRGTLMVFTERARQIIEESRKARKEEAKQEVYAEMRQWFEEYEKHGGQYDEPPPWETRDEDTQSKSNH